MSLKNGPTAYSQIARTDKVQMMVIKPLYVSYDKDIMQLYCVNDTRKFMNKIKVKKRNL